jgi:GNAT superfamily N-acetyltransferase
MTGNTVRADQVWRIEPAISEDRAWMMKIYRQNKHVMGPPDLRGLTQSIDGLTPNIHWSVVRPHAFAMWRMRRDGVRFLSRIIVDESMRNCGIGIAILNHIGKPILLHTQSDNVHAIEYYKRRGFTTIGNTYTRRGNIPLTWLLLEDA